MKFITKKTIQTISELVPDLYQLGTCKLFQLAVLQLTSQQLKWAYHSDISSIKSTKMNTTRLAVQTAFQNHLVDWEGIRTRKFDVEQYEKYQCLDLHAAFYRRFYDDQNNSKPEERKNIFINCPNFSIQYFRYNNFLYRQHLNKIICMPHQKLPDLSPELQNMCMKLNIKLLPMKQCNYQSILKFIKTNYTGNILVNGPLSSHDFITDQKSLNKPKQIMIFLDNEYSRRSTSKKLMFPAIDTLLQDYDVLDQYKLDNRISFMDLINKKQVQKQKLKMSEEREKRKQQYHNKFKKQSKKQKQAKKSTDKSQ